MTNRSPNLAIGVNVIAVARNVDTGEETIHTGKNLLVNTGRIHIRDMIGGSATRPNDMKVGTGTNAVASTDVDLQTPVLTKTIQRRSDGSFSVEFQSLVLTSEANGNTLSEVGTFYFSTLIARTLISPVIVKTSSIEVTLSHVFTVNAT